MLSAAILATDGSLGLAPLFNKFPLAWRHVLVPSDRLASALAIGGLQLSKLSFRDRILGADILALQTTGWYGRFITLALSILGQRASARHGEKRSRRSTR